MREKAVADMNKNKVLRLVTGCRKEKNIHIHLNFLLLFLSECLFGMRTTCCDIVPRRSHRLHSLILEAVNFLCDETSRKTGVFLLFPPPDVLGVVAPYPGHGAAIECDTPHRGQSLSTRRFQIQNDAWQVCLVHSVVYPVERHGNVAQNGIWQNPGRFVVDILTDCRGLLLRGVGYSARGHPHHFAIDFSIRSDRTDCSQIRNGETELRKCLLCQQQVATLPNHVEWDDVRRSRIHGREFPRRVPKDAGQSRRLRVYLGLLRNKTIHCQELSADAIGGPHWNKLICYRSASGS